MPQYLDLEAHTTVNVSELLGGVKPPPPKVKDYYDKGLWSIERVRAAVGKWITAAEYEEITGEPY